MNYAKNVLLYCFLMRPCIAIRGFVRPSVGPSVYRCIRLYVRPLRLCKNRVSWLFMAMVRSYTKSNDRQTYFESLLHYSVVASVYSSICLPIYVTCSIQVETQSGRIDAQSGLFTCISQCHFIPTKTNNYCVSTLNKIIELEIT